MLISFLGSGHLKELLFCSVVSLLDFFMVSDCVSPWLGLLFLGKGGSHNTIFAGFCLQEKVIPLHRLRWRITGFILTLAVLWFSLSYELSPLVLISEPRIQSFFSGLASLMAEIRHVCSLSSEEAHVFRSDGCFTWWEELVSSSLSHVWALGLVNLNVFSGLSYVWPLCLM